MEELINIKDEGIESFDGFNGRLVRGNSTFGSLGGSSGHNHKFSFQSSSTPAFFQNVAVAAVRCTFFV